MPEKTDAVLGPQCALRAARGTRDCQGVARGRLVRSAFVGLGADAAGGRAWRPTAAPEQEHHDRRGRTLRGSPRPHGGLTLRGCGEVGCWDRYRWLAVRVVCDRFTGVGVARRRDG